MHEMRTIAIDDPVAWASVSLSRWRLFLLICQMAPLRCGRYYITAATCLKRHSNIVRTSSSVKLQSTKISAIIKNSSNTNPRKSMSSRLQTSLFRCCDPALVCERKTGLVIQTVNSTKHGGNISSHFQSDIDYAFRLSV